MSQPDTPKPDRPKPDSVSANPSSLDDNGHSRFTFVLDKDQPGTRTHAMRAHWQDRRRRKQQEKLRDRSRRPLRSKSDSSRDLLASDCIDETGPHIRNQNINSNNTESSSGFYSFFVSGYANVFHPDPPRLQYPENEKNQMLDLATSSLQGVPTQFLTGVNHALSSSRLDPFEVFPVMLTSQHHKLIHHWLTTHATMMFDHIPTSDFNPMRDVWFPLDLSNAASFNAIMAHAAAHLAYYYGGTGPTRGTNSSEALKYKSNAVEILSQWLHDPERALSNDAFAAVVRLLTFERYWGTEEEWQIHRDGLQRMIEARGGLQELHDDWRLELVVGLVSLMSHPTWFDSTNNISAISHPKFQQTLLQGIGIDIHRMRSLWLISFIQDMRNLMSMSSELYRDGLSIFSTLYDAVVLIRTDFEMDVFSSASSSAMKTGYSASDYDRLASLFAISIVVEESVSFILGHPPTAGSTTGNKNALALLDMSLFSAPITWKSSVHGLRSFLDSHFLQFYLEGAQKLDYVRQMTDVVSHLSLEAHRGIEKCLLNMFCRRRTERMFLPADDGATPDSLLASVHGQ